MSEKRWQLDVNLNQQSSVKTTHKHLQPELLQLLQLLDFAVQTLHDTEQTATLRCQWAFASVILCLSLNLVEQGRQTCMDCLASCLCFPVIHEAIVFSPLQADMFQLPKKMTEKLVHMSNQKHGKSLCLWICHRYRSNLIRICYSNEISTQLFYFNTTRWTLQ